LFWWGDESPSVYPPGTSVAFSVATDSTVGPGVVRSSAATYTPQNDPHYYIAWHGQVLGPSLTVAEDLTARLTGGPATVVLPDLRSSLSTNLTGDDVKPAIGSLTPLPGVSIAMRAAITVEGVVGTQYGIQYNTDLKAETNWHGLANVILTAPKLTYYDSLPGSGPQRYYRILPGPIAVP
jgi:hypothetical protein